MVLAPSLYVSTSSACKRVRLCTDTGYEALCLVSTAQAERDEMIAKTDDLFAASVGEHTTEKERKNLCHSLSFSLNGVLR